MTPIDNTQPATDVPLPATSRGGADDSDSTANTGTGITLNTEWEKDTVIFF